jgi:uncharacterized protein
MCWCSGVRSSSGSRSLQLELEVTSTSESLCLSCGLCCDGTLYGGVGLEGEDQARLARRSLPVVPSHTGVSLRQPCAAHIEGACSIYEDRPGACARYRCALLKQVDAGEVSTSAALALVRETRTLVARVRERLAAWSSEPSPWRALALAEEQMGTDAWRRENADLLLDVGELVLRLCRTFDERFRQRDAADRKL